MVLAQIFHLFEKKSILINILIFFFTILYYYNKYLKQYNEFVLLHHKSNQSLSL